MKIYFWLLYSYSFLSSPFCMFALSSLYSFLSFLFYFVFPHLIRHFLLLQPPHYHLRFFNLILISFLPSVLLSSSSFSSALRVSDKPTER